jgi:hypothetical protein
LDLKYLEWIQQGKKAAVEAALLEAEKNDPFANEESPFDQRNTSEESKAEQNDR